MEESIFYITFKIQIYKGITTTQVNNFVRTFVVKLRGVETENHF